MEKICNYINGRFVPPKSEEYIKNISPVDGVHYSPEANKKIAFYINDIINEYYEK